MELYQTNGDIERRLSIKADIAKIPLGGTFELLPLCNMNCEMCYIKENPHTVAEAGGLLTCENWIQIAQEAKNCGTLFLLLTGGEPLLYPDFKKLYITLHKMGFILQINTNGTLITEEIADLFAEYKPRQINITLYGASNATYNNLCHNPQGFTQVTSAINMLMDRNVSLRITCSLTPYNEHDLEKIIQYVQNNNLPFSPNEYMFPSLRSSKADNFIRFSPEECAKTKIRSRLLMHKETDFPTQAELLLNKVKHCQPLLPHQKSFQCRAGRSGFWVSWKGDLLACGMMDNPSIDLLKCSFKKSWEFIVAECRKILLCDDCANCNKRSICNTCIAAAYIENGGKYNQKPQYLCDMTDEMIRLAEKIEFEEFSNKE